MAETAKEAPDQRDVDEEEVLAEAWSRSLNGLAGAAWAWTVGVAVFAVALVGTRLLGPGGLPGETLRIFASVAGLVGVALFSFSRLAYWHGRVATIDGRVERWRKRRRLRWLQLAVVLTLGFLAGMLLWEVQFEAWGLFFVLVGYPLTLFAGYRVWETIDEDSRQLAILGWVTAGVYPLAAVAIPQLAEPLVVGGYALVAAAFAQAASRFDADDLEDVEDLDEPDDQVDDEQVEDAQAEPSR